MKIPVTLNDKKIVLDAEPDEPLLYVLRREKLFSVKCGCEKGICGNCMVLLDGECANSCIVPVGLVRDSTIVTLEHFKTYPEYQDINMGFSQAGIHLCGYCTAGKMLTAYSVLRGYARPDKKQLFTSLQGLVCCCTDYDTLANGILYAVAAKHTREGKKANVKK